MKKTLLTCLLVVSALTQIFAVEKQKIIIYTDIGDDIDDIYAVSLALASPEFEILGIVVGYGNTPKRGPIACRLLYEVGREDIPVVIGRKTNDTYWNQYYWGEGFNKVKPIKQAADDFIIEQLKKYPNEVTLVLLAPIPDIADVIKKDPQALKLAKQTVSMMGSFYLGYENSVPSAEWNVVADLNAAKEFIPYDVKKTLAGLDITIFVKLIKKYRNRIFLRNSPLTDCIAALYTLQRYEKYSLPDSNLFDMVAVGILLWPDLYKVRSAYIKVTENGYTVIDESKAPNSQIGMSVDKNELLKRFTERILRQNLMRK